MNMDEVLSRLGTEGYGELLARLVKKNWKDGYEWGWEEGKGKGPSGVDEWTLRALEEKVIQLSEETGKRLKGDLRAALAEGVKNREGVSELRSRVGKVFEELEGWKTERVVRTEISQATHQGRNAAWIVAGVMKWKMWWNPDVSSKRTADDSKRMHGQIQRIEDSFVDPGTGKVHMTPPNRPQCRCGMRVLAELPKDLVWIGGLMYDGRYVQTEAMKKSPTILDDLDIEKAWTDEARKKALEARRRKMKREDWEQVKKWKEELRRK